MAVDETVVKRAVEEAMSKAAKVAEKNQPRQLELNPYEQVLVDNIKWRELAAKRAIELGKRDLDEVARMKEQLIQTVGQKHQLGDEWRISVDVEKKTATAIPKQ